MMSRLCSWIQYFTTLASFAFGSSFLASFVDFARQEFGREIMSETDSQHNGPQNNFLDSCTIVIILLQHQAHTLLIQDKIESNTNS